MRFALALHMDLKGFGGMGQALIAPLVVLGLTDLMRSAEFGDRLALEALNDDHRYGVGIPFPSSHG
jgi:hypothetical protein